MPRGERKCDPVLRKILQGLADVPQYLREQGQIDVLIESDRPLLLPEEEPRPPLLAILKEAWNYLEGLSALVRRIGGEERERLTICGGLSARIPVAALPALLERPQVRRVTLLRPIYVLHLHQSGVIISAREAESAGYTGENVTVAVLDSGIEDRHPALQGRVSKKQSFVKEEDLSHKMSDYLSQLFPQGLEREPTPQAAANARAHGTHVAGIIASQDKQYRGIAPECQLWDLQVTTAEGISRLDWLLKALEWLLFEAARGSVDHCHIVNISVGMGQPQNHLCPQNGSPCALCQSAQNLVHAGLIVVASAGNEGHIMRKSINQISCPGQAPGVICVAASTVNAGAEGISHFSSRGPGRLAAFKPDVCAPGASAPEHIISCVDSSWGPMEGTSMAAPHVAGACALLKQKDSTIRPRELKALLCATARRLPGFPPEAQGAGRIDIKAALNLLEQKAASPESYQLAIAPFKDKPDSFGGPPPPGAPSTAHIEVKLLQELTEEKHLAPTIQQIIARLMQHILENLGFKVLSPRTKPKKASLQFTITIKEIFPPRKVEWERIHIDGTVEVKMHSQAQQWEIRPSSLYEWFSALWSLCAAIKVYLAFFRSVAALFPAHFARMLFDEDWDDFIRFYWLRPSVPFLLGCWEGQETDLSLPHWCALAVLAEQPTPYQRSIIQRWSEKALSRQPFWEHEMAMKLLRAMLDFALAPTLREEIISVLKRAALDTEDTVR